MSFWMVLFIKLSKVNQGLTEIDGMILNFLKNEILLIL